MSYYRQKQRWPEAIPQEPPFPDSLGYLWDWYEELAYSRSSSGFGPNPITYVDIEAWGRLCSVDLSRWEVQTIRILDMLNILHTLPQTEQPNE